MKFSSDSSSSSETTSKAGGKHPASWHTNAKSKKERASSESLDNRLISNNNKGQGHSSKGIAGKVALCFFGCYCYSLVRFGALFLRVTCAIFFLEIGNFKNRELAQPNPPKNYAIVL